MIINFVGNFQFGYTGEVSDETHLARELQKLGHTIQRVPRDIFKAWCEGESNPDWEDKLPIKADINIIAKWDKFDAVDYCDRLRAASDGAPVFYWVWDYMLDPIFPKWHLDMARSADLYLSGELGLADLYKKEGVKFYYFQFDVCDGSLPTFRDEPKKYDVVFTGSFLGQGDRIEYLTKINEALPGKLQIFSWNFEEWKKRGFEAYPAVYGPEYNLLIAKSKIVLGLSVEANCAGYWSNRVGKVLRAGGFLLQQYAPLMEQFLAKYPVLFFSTPDEAIAQINDWLGLYSEVLKRREVTFPAEFTSGYKTVLLVELIKRYLKGDSSKWII